MSQKTELAMLDELHAAALQVDEAIEDAVENPEQRYDILRIAMDKSDKALHAIEAAQKKLMAAADDPEGADHLGLNAMAATFHQNAKDHGWYDEPRGFPEVIALMHSELSEALEEHRDGKPHVYYKCASHDTRMKCPDKFDGCQMGDNAGCMERKPEGIAIELIDCMIRILDTCAYMGIDIEAAIMAKHEYNKTRPYRHGGKAC